MYWVRYRVVAKHDSETCRVSGGDARADGEDLTGFKNLSGLKGFDVRVDAKTLQVSERWMDQLP